jgi:hypothetical protein
MGEVPSGVIFPPARNPISLFWAARWRAETSTRLQTAIYFLIAEFCSSTAEIRFFGVAISYFAGLDASFAQEPEML